MKKVVAVVVMVAACGSKSSKVGDKQPLAQKPYNAKDLPEGLELRLSQGKQGAPAYDHAKLAQATKLSDGDVQALLARTKPIAVEATDQKDFALRPASQPPPRTGNVIASSFPPPPSDLRPPPATNAGKPLEVLRYAPEGAVPIAPELSVTFSQPMVAVTSQEDAATTTPVKLTPTPKGKWRWLGTRTILFDPDPRFPQATTYTVEVPAGTKSATGQALAKATKFTFETPPPTLVSHYPDEYSPQKLDVPMFVVFDQKIDRDAVLAQIKVTATKGWDGKPMALLLADAKEDKQLASLIDGAEKGEQTGRYLAFRTVDKLPADATIDVSIPAGTPSAEGPNKTKTAQHFTFKTYPPLKLEAAECGYNHECRPGMAFQLRFDNPLDADHFDESLVTISPELPGAKIIQSGNSILVTGLQKARTHYDVTISSKLVDDFGQTLGKDEKRGFDVGDAYPTFFGPSGLVVLDPEATKPTLDFFTTNYDDLKVRLYQVDASDFDAFMTYQQNQWNHDHPPTPPGKKVFDDTIHTTGGSSQPAGKPAGGALVETHIDLRPALGKGDTGFVMAIVEPSPWKEKYDPPRMIAFVQATKLGIDAHVDNDNLVAYASDLATGKPASGVELEVHPFGLKGTTDDSGVATIALSDTQQRGEHYLLARKGNDAAFVTGGSGYYGNNWSKRAVATQLAWYVIDDRKMYKPGEDVSLKGWLRAIDPGKGGDVAGLAGRVTGISYKVYDSRNNQIGAGTASVNEVGGFDTKFTLPKTPNLGYARVELVAQGSLPGANSHTFQIEEFRRPEFEVSAHAGAGPFIIGDSGDVTVSAKYYAGGPLPGADVNWYVSASQTSFTPPNRDDYVFGRWTPWWGEYAFDEMGPIRSRPQKTWSLQGKTDAAGEHVMHVDFVSVNPAVPMSVTANATVTDVSRQAWNAPATLIVHPSSLYVGMKMKKPFVEKGTPFDVDVIGVDLDGKAAAGAKIDVKAVRLDWEFKHGKYATKEVDPQACAVVAAEAAQPCHFQTQTGGTYQVTATIVDSRGRPNQTQLEFWVSGGEGPPAREVAQEKVQLIPDKKEYAPGDTAELLVQAPFAPAEGVVTWRRSGIVKTEHVALTGPTTTIHVPIADAMTPNIYVQVDLVGAAARTDDKGQPDPRLPRRPAYAVGTIDLSVPPKQRTLAVQVAPSAAKVAPGETTKIAVDVKDAAGKPVAGAEAAVIVVDESVLSLTGYQIPTPIDTFYTQRPPGATDFYSRSYVKLAKPDADALGVIAQAEGGRGGMANGIALATAPAAPGAMRLEAESMDGDLAENKPMDSVTRDDLPKASLAFKQKVGGKHEAEPQVAIRTNFNPLAAFSPAIKTDAAGHAVLEVKVPDNLTRYRIVAVAAAGEKQFGKGESSLVARLPLMVRPSPPRFLNFGDTFELPVVVQNQTDAPMTVRVAVRSANAQLTDGAGRAFTVPANDRALVEFPASAEMAGTARFQIVGAAGNASDAAELALPVWTPATTEAFATYGVIDNGSIQQPVALPGKVVTQFGGLEITTASTNLQSLTDAVLYLVHYPFECAEQRSSRVLAIAALRDVLAAFKAKDMPSPQALEASVAQDIEHLTQMQNSDGGFAWWDRGHPSDPYLTVFVTNALGRAKAKGFAVPQPMLDNAKRYLANIENYYPSYYGEDIRRAISAYALYTRKQLGDVDIAKGKRFFAQWGVDKVSMETNGWLLGLFAGNAQAADERKTIVRYALNHVSETAGAANFTVGYGDGAYLILSSDRRVDGVMLESLIQEDPQNDLIPKLVTGLLAHRTAGHWLNTQENAFVLQALDLYFNTYEKATPSFVARVWLGNDYAGDHAFRGRSTDYAQINVAMKDVVSHDKSNLTIQKDGTGRLYYRIGMKYAPASLKLEPADFGFVVERTYEGADDAKDVTRAADGTWHIKAGARVRVKLKMMNENRRYHVALVDPLPAGLEPMNPALAVTGPIPQDPNEQKARGRYWWWQSTWYEHQNMRDERVEAFASLLWEGVHEYSYVARATTPGTFIVPPTKAEEMYMPETFGRGGSDKVIVDE